MSDQVAPQVKPGKLTRRELHDLVWSTPLHRLAPAFGCSDTWLKRLCRESGVPTPHRGYWAKLVAGKKPKRRELARGLDPDEVVMEVRNQPPPTEATSAPKPAPHAPDVAALLERIEATPLPTDFSKVAKLPSMIAARRWLRDDTHRAGRYSDGTIGFGRNSHAFQVCVSESGADRALRFLGLLLATLDAHGLLASRTDRDEPVSFASIFGTPLEFRIHERHLQRDYDPKRDPKPERFYGTPRFIFTPTGRFHVEMRTRGRFARAEWSDGKHGKVDERLREILRDAVVVAATERASREAWRLQELRDAEVRREEARREQERQAEARRVDAVLEQAWRWDRAAMVRRFADACRRSAEASQEGAASAKNAAWLVWLDGVARTVDPLARGLDAVVNATANPD